MSPDFTFLKHFLSLDIKLINFVIITTSEESTLLLDNFKTPSFTVMMRSIDKLLVSSIDINSLDDTIVVTNSDLSIQNIN